MHMQMIFKTAHEHLPFLPAGQHKKWRTTAFKGLLYRQPESHGVESLGQSFLRQEGKFLFLGRFE